MHRCIEYRILYCGWMDGWEMGRRESVGKDGCVGGWVDRWVGGWMGGWVDGWVGGWEDEQMG